jgi:hypothetical protein
VCHFEEQANLEQLCVSTDGAGGFELFDAEYMSIRIGAAGYFPQVVEAQGHQEIVLERSPTLTVRLIDASSRKPIDSGEVFVVYPSAKKKGPFPTNRAGVRITRILQPGEVRLIARADGYEDSDPYRIELERGGESEATLELRPKPEQPE